MNHTDDKTPLEDKAITSARRQGFFLAIAGLAGGGFFLWAMASLPEKLTGFLAADIATILFTAICGVSGIIAFATALSVHQQK